MTEYAEDYNKEISEEIQREIVISVRFSHCKEKL